MYGGHEGFGFAGGFMWIFWILIIVVIAVVLKGIFASGSNTASSESPMEILKKRYANGEISDEEFEHSRKELEK